MKAPITNHLLYFFLVGLLIPAFLPQVEGRIGETRDQIERRLLSSGGIVYRDEATKSNRLRGMAYVSYLDLMPEAELRIYFKSADGSQPKSSEMNPRYASAGWDLHVLYIGGRSVLEVYKRSSSMTEMEFNRLLKLQAGNSYWKRLESRAQDEEHLSIFGCNMEREDGLARASRRGSTLLIVSLTLDEELARRKTQQETEDAPTSVNGF